MKSAQAVIFVSIILSAHAQKAVQQVLPLANFTLKPADRSELKLDLSAFLNPLDTKIIVRVDSEMPSWMTYRPFDFTFVAMTPPRQRDQKPADFEVSLSVVNGAVGAGDRLMALKTGFWVLFDREAWSANNTKPIATPGDLFVPPLRVFQHINHMGSTNVSISNITQYQYKLPEELFYDEDGDELELSVMHVASNRNLPEWFRFEQGIIQADVSLNGVLGSINESTVICYNTTDEVEIDDEPGTLQCVLPLFIAARDSKGASTARTLWLPVLIVRWTDTQTLPVLVNECFWEVESTRNGSFKVDVAFVGSTDKIKFDEFNSSLTFRDGRVTGRSNNAGHFVFAFSNPWNRGWSLDEGQDAIIGAGSTLCQIIVSPFDYSGDITLKHPSNETVAIEVYRSTENEALLLNYTIPWSLFDYESASRPRVRVLDVAGRSMPMWLQVDNVEEGIRFQGYADIQSGSFDASIIVYTDEGGSTFMTANIRVEQHLPPIPKSSLVSVDAVSGSYFSHPLQSTFPADVDINVLTVPFDWLKFSKANVSLHGLVPDGLNATNASLYVVGTDSDNAFSAYLLKLQVYPEQTTSKEEPLAVPGFVLSPLLITVIVLFSLVLLVSIAICYGYYRFRKIEKAGWLRRQHQVWNRDSMISAEFMAGEREPDYAADYMDYLISLQWLCCVSRKNRSPAVIKMDEKGKQKSRVRTYSQGSFEEIDLDEAKSIIIGDNGVIRVRTQVGKALHFAYPVERLASSLGTRHHHQRDQSWSTMSRYRDENTDSFVSEGSSVAEPSYRSHHPQILEMSLLSETSASSSSAPVSGSSSRSHSSQETAHHPETRGLFKFSARLASGLPLPAWLHFNTSKCVFFGAPYVFDKGMWKIEVRCAFYETSFDSVPVDEVSETFLLEVADDRPPYI